MKDRMKIVKAAADHKKKEKPPCKTGFAKAGFTLVETVVSLALLGVMLMLVTGIFASAAAKTAENLKSERERELLLASFEESAVTGRAAGTLARQAGELTLDFNGKKISAEGEYLTGVYGENRIIMRYFLLR